MEYISHNSEKYECTDTLFPSSGSRIVYPSFLTSSDRVSFKINQDVSPNLEDLRLRAGAFSLFLSLELYTLIYTQWYDLETI